MTASYIEALLVWTDILGSYSGSLQGMYTYVNKFCLIIFILSLSYPCDQSYIYAIKGYVTKAVFVLSKKGT